MRSLIRRDRPSIQPAGHGGRAQSTQICARGSATPGSRDPRQIGGTTRVLRGSHSHSAVPAAVRRLVEHRLPELVVAAVAGDSYVSHAAAALGGLPGRLADARRPAHLRLARPQLVTARAAFGLILEQRNAHPNDRTWTSRYASMITAAGSEPGPGGVGPGAVIRTGCADRRSGAQGKRRMGQGNGSPGNRSGLDVSPGRAACAHRRQAAGRSRSRWRDTAA